MNAYAVNAGVATRGNFAGGTTMTDLDIRDVARCSCLRWRRITRRVTRIYDHLLEPVGLTVNQFGLLARLYGANLRQEILPIGSLAERMGMDATSLNRCLKPLEVQGFVSSATDLADRGLMGKGAGGTQFESHL
jgi:MarR family